jgi:nitrogen regulatory protein P-II 1
MVKITAIIRTTVLERVEQKLREMRVSGLTISEVKGYGQSADVLSKDWMSRKFRLELFTSQDRADEIVRALLETASTGLDGDGIIAVSQVSSIYRICDKRALLENEI